MACREHARRLPKLVPLLAHPFRSFILYNRVHNARRLSTEMMVGTEQRHGHSPRNLRRTSLYLDEKDRQLLSSLTRLLGLRRTEILRLALRTLAHRYDLLPSGKEVKRKGADQNTSGSGHAM